MIFDYLFRYKDDSEPEKIGMEGVVKFLEDLQLDPRSRTVLIIAWKFQAQQQCEFSKDEFFSGMIELGECMCMVNKVIEDEFDYVVQDVTAWIS